MVPMDIKRSYKVVFSGTVRIIDTAIVDGPLVTTIELKRSGEGIAGDFWISGLRGPHQLSVVLRFQTILCDVLSEPDALMRAEQLYKSHLRALALESMGLGGIAESIYPPQTELRKLLAGYHLSLHKDAGNIPANGRPVADRTALEYNLIRSFGHRAAVPLIAEFEGISSVAAVKRISLARLRGFLAKVSEEPSSNELNEK
jgi:hypothetical protein